MVVELVEMMEGEVVVFTYYTVYKTSEYPSSRRITILLLLDKNYYFA